MPLKPPIARLRTLLGWCWLTPIEWAILALIVALFYWGVVPHYRRWQYMHRLEEEQQVVAQVRAALTSVQAARPCPDVLDTCPDGASAAECPFFVRALDEPVRSPLWRKYDGGYLGPAGGYYRYESRGCRLLQAPAPRDTS